MTLQKLREIYYNNGAAAFSRPDILYNVAKKEIPNLTRTAVAEFLRSEPSYYTFTNKRSIRPRHYPQRYYHVSTLNKLWSCDVFYLRKYGHGGGIKAIFVCVDVFSKFIRIAPLKRINGESVLRAFRKMIENQQPKNIITDRGPEMLKMRQFCQQNGIDHYYSPKQSPNKATHAERAVSFSS